MKYKALPIASISEILEIIVDVSFSNCLLIMLFLFQKKENKNILLFHSFPK